MLYLILILLALFIAFLLLNVRIRFQLSDARKLLFVGVGRSGPEFDFTGRIGSVKLFGVKIKSFEIGKEKKRKEREAEAGAKEAKAAEPPKPSKPPKRARVSLRDLYRIGPKCIKPLWAYLVSVLKAVVVEELEGRVQAGFDSPDLTGAVFGYYQAALAAMPGVVGRLRYVPDWIGPSFTGAGRVSVAIPVYKLLLRTMVLTYRLPLRDLLKLAIRKKKGVSDV